MQLYFESRTKWRQWLKLNYNKEKVIWFVFYKKSSGKQTVSYNDAVEEALCFGWIDSTINSIDDEKYCQKFTPRTNYKNWSPTNIERMRKLIDSKQMTPAGLAKFDLKLLEFKNIEEIKDKKDSTLTESDFFIEELKKNPKAEDYYFQLAKSHRKNMFRWVDSAKRQETKHKRMQEVIALLINKEKIGLK